MLNYYEFVKIQQIVNKTRPVPRGIYTGLYPAPRWVYARLRLALRGIYAGLRPVPRLHTGRCPVPRLEPFLRKRF